MSTTKNYDLLSLEEIKAIKDKKIKFEYLKQYRSDIEYFCSNKAIISIIKNLYGKPIHYICDVIENFKHNNTSNYFTELNDNIVFIHNKYNISKAKAEGICSICGDPIRIGDHIVRYNPLIYNMERNESFVLEKPFIIKERCNHSMPTTISELDILALNIKENPDYDDVRSNYNEELVLRKLKRKQRNVK